MHWEKEIRIRITIRRLVIAVLAASTVTNLVIVGAAVGVDSPPATPTSTSLLPTPVFTNTFLIPVSGTGEAPTSTQIPGITPTELFTPTPTSTDLPISIVCIKRFFWPTYQVQPGDTLFFLASATGSTVGELRLANCLVNDQIDAGQVIHLPRLLNKIITPTDTPTASSTATQTATDTPSATPSFTPTATTTPSPTGTMSETPTSTPTATFTDTPTETPTPTPTNPPTIFENPRAFISCASSGVYNFSFSVLPIDSDGLGSVTALYRINDSLELIKVPMGPDGATYYGFVRVQGSYSTKDTIHYRFDATDLPGYPTESTEFTASLINCP
jgi:LysM repeat protein